MRDTLFSNLTVAANSLSSPSRWIRIDDSMSQHTVNGYFAGAGILQLFYESSSEKSALWVPEQVIPPNLDMLTVANGDTPFEESIDLIANEFIRWYARNVHATNSITGLYGNFVQKGRTS